MNAHDFYPRTPRRTRLSLRPALLLVVFGLGACSTVNPPEPNGFSQTATRRIYAAAYQHIAEKYIEQTPLQELVMAGMDGLRHIEPDLMVQLDNGHINLALPERTVARFAVSAEANANNLAAATSAALVAGRAASPRLAAASPEAIYQSAFNGMMAHLDGPSKYARPEAAERQRAARQGFGGVGITIRKARNDEAPGLVVIDIVPDSPADQAGLWAGDRISRIGETATPKMSIQDAAEQLRGPAGSTVDLTVIREAGAARAVTLARAHIVPPTVTYRRVGTILNLTISRFNQGTAGDVTRALSRSRHSADETLSGIVIDLRDNPGGLLDQAVSIADIFLDDGLIATTIGRHPASNQRFEASGTDLTGGMPLVILVNGRSASASEVLAAALQERGRAVVVGSASYGKGTVQTVLELPNRSELTLTWSRLHTPSGQTLQGFGVLPTVCTSAGPGAAGDLDAALREGRKALAEIQRQQAPLTADRDEAHYRDSCPPDKAAPALDESLAQRLLDEPRSYAHALDLARPAMAAHTPDATAR